MSLRRMGRLTIAASLGHAALATRRQWRALPADRRNRLHVLMRQAATGPTNLSPAERQELRELVGELNLGEVLRDSAMRTPNLARRTCGARRRPCC
jgi:hypothetical protein